MNTLSKPQASQKTIYIVEDEFLVANALRLILEKAGYIVSDIALSVDKALELIREKRPDLVLIDIYLNGAQTGIDLARLLNQDHIPFVYLSANTNASIMEEAKMTKPYGFLAKPFREKDVLIALEMAHFRHAHSTEMQLRQEQALQIEITDTLSEEGDWEQRLLKVARLFQPHIPYDYLTIGWENDKMINTFQSYGFFRIGSDEYQTISMATILKMTGLTPAKYQAIRNESHYDYDQLAICTGDDFDLMTRRNPLQQLITKTFRLTSTLFMRLKTAQDGDFLFSFYSRPSDAFKPDHVKLLERIQPSLMLTIDRLMAFDRIEKLTEQLRQENSYLLEEVKAGADFETIIGQSPALLQVFNSINQVACTDMTVTIQGETGTGKELIARAVHNRSNRRNNPLIKINCAALPPQLIESELFGHEKGSFTGAASKRIGKFELANRGTIFLDEIGELPLELQPKLLRVLQEKEIERIGGSSPIPCDVRVIAATNRNLLKEVEEGRFRSDLFYRLNAFPITIPPLRERLEDIPTLSSHFLQKIAKKLGKQLTCLSETSLKQMRTYHWPGNIRELEHLMERAAIMSTTPEVSLIEPLIGDLQAFSLVGPSMTVKPLRQAQRDTILAALQQANNRIRGKGGAAELLCIKPTTLEAKIARIGGIRRGRG